MNRVMRSVWLAAALLACSGPENTPQAVLRHYLDAIAAGDVERAAQYVTKEDASAAGGRNLRATEANARLFAPDARFEIGTVKVDGDTAEANVTVSMPAIDLKESVQLLQAIAEKNAGERDRVLNGARKRPFSSSVETYKLVREGDLWRVSPGWSAEKASYAAMVARAEKSKADAVRYAQEMPVEVRVVEKNSSRFVEGTVANRTRATITKLDIVLEYRDQNGTIIFKDENHPVMTQRGDDEALRNYARDFYPPLGPGELRKISYLVPDDVPSSWNGDVTGRPIDVEFDREP